jgi:uncharacterized protein
MNLLPLDELAQEMPFWDLFVSLREAELPLNVEQYHELKQSVRWGHVLTWEDLATVGSLVWVKPSDSNWQQQEFDRILQAYQQKPPAEQPSATSMSSAESFPEPQANHSETKVKMPEFPMRASPQGEHKIASAVKSPKSTQLATNSEWKLSLEKLPLSTDSVKNSWLVWRQHQQLSEFVDLDAGQTIQQSTEGLLENLVWQQATNQNGDLVVLVDDGENMLTYWPAMGKLFEAIHRKRINPAQMYRFSGCPRRYLYDWRQPNKSILTTKVRGNLSSNQTMLLVVSDGGAAIGLPDEDRVTETLEFLQEWQDFVRPIIWLNPVPSDRWAGTPAAKIEQSLGGRMLGLDQFSGAKMQRLIGSRGWQRYF